MCRAYGKVGYGSPPPLNTRPERLPGVCPGPVNGERERRSLKPSLVLGSVDVGPSWTRGTHARSSERQRHASKQYELPPLQICFQILQAPRFHDCHVPVQNTLLYKLESLLDAEEDVARTFQTLICSELPSCESIQSTWQTRFRESAEEGLEAVTQNALQSSKGEAKRTLGLGLEDPDKVHITCYNLQRMYHTAHLAHGVVVVRFKILPGSFGTL